MQNESITLPTSALELTRAGKPRVCMTNAVNCIKTDVRLARIAVELAPRGTPHDYSRRAPSALLATFRDWLGRRAEMHCGRELAYGAALAALAECGGPLGLARRVLAHHETRIELLYQARGIVYERWRFERDERNGMNWRPEGIEWQRVGEPDRWSPEFARIDAEFEDLERLIEQEERDAREARAFVSGLEAGEQESAA